MNTPVIEIKNLKKDYRLGTIVVHALREVSLTVNKAEYGTLGLRENYFNEHHWMFRQAGFR